MRSIEKIVPAEGESELREVERSAVHESEVASGERESDEEDKAVAADSVKREGTRRTTTNALRADASSDQMATDRETDAAAEGRAKEPMPPVDAGAAAFMTQLRQRIDEVPAVDADAERESLTIGLSHMRNMSRARSNEFARLKVRLATLFTDAGRDYGIQFVVDDEHASADYELTGSAYLIFSDGFDLWELHLALKQTDRALTIWHVGEPVYVLRTERTSSRQVFFGQTGGR